MGNVSRNFNKKEFDCRCGCGLNNIKTAIIIVVQDVRDHFGKRVTINSGCRCEAHNRAVGGSAKSRHPEGDATDIEVEDTPTKEVYAYLNEKWGALVGLGLANSFTHVDTRNNGPAARWTY